MRLVDILSVGGVLQNQQLELFEMNLNQGSGWTNELMSEQSVDEQELDNFFSFSSLFKYLWL